MRRSNCASALQYVPELTWILFLRLLDAQEARDQEEADAVGVGLGRRLRAECERLAAMTSPQGGGLYSIGVPFSCRMDSRTSSNKPGELFL